jgi:hypothetical protein
LLVIASDGFPRQVLLPKLKAEEFLNGLAGSEPLHVLASAVPHANKGDTLIKIMSEREVPVRKAMW